MSIGSLDSALSGLRIAQQQLSVISGNVSNVNTPGYSRKILPQSAISAYGVTVGVRADNIIRNADLNLTRDFWTQTSTVSGLEVKSAYLNRIQEFHGDPALEMNVAADMARMRDSLSALADSPEDVFLQHQAVNQAKNLAGKINSFAGLIHEMRNDTQAEIKAAVEESNALLEQIADLNKQIRVNISGNRTTAALEDMRDDAVQKLSQNLEISFFTRGDGVMVVQTAQGVQLTAERADKIYFSPTALGPATGYDRETGMNGLFVGGNPATTPNAINITETGIGGKIGALIELRDQSLPAHQAQIDEMAHKLAMRMDSQGLRLFTDQIGEIPANTDPIPAPPSPATPVSYVGFANVMQVNPMIVVDNGLIQQGTVPTDVPVQQGSNEVIRRVLQFAFGDVHYQQATGGVDLRANGTGGVSMQEWLGLSSSNSVTGRANLSQYADIDAIIAAGGHDVFGTPPVQDMLRITFSETRTGLGPTQIDVSLLDAQTNYPINPPAINNALDQIIAEINAQIAAAPTPPGLNASATRNAYGQLVIQSAGEIEIEGNFVGGMFDAGLNMLGLENITVPTTDPYIEIQIGNDPPVRVTIEPGDTETDFMQKLQYDPLTGRGVPGLWAEMDPATGHLNLRPGADNGSGGSLFGGDIKITSNLFTTDGSGASGVPAGSSIIAALFGTASPVSDVLYADTMPFRSGNLGPGANIRTGVISATNLIEFAQKMISRHTEEINFTDNSLKDETSYQSLLQQKTLDLSGVNIDEEMSHLIVVQTAYSAAARAVSAVDSMFQELLNAIR